MFSKSAFQLRYEQLEELKAREAHIRRLRFEEQAKVMEEKNSIPKAPPLPAYLSWLEATQPSSDGKIPPAPPLYDYLMYRVNKSILENDRCSVYSDYSESSSEEDEEFSEYSEDESDFEFTDEELPQQASTSYGIRDWSDVDEESDHEYEWDNDDGSVHTEVKEENLTLEEFKAKMTDLLSVEPMTPEIEEFMKVISKASPMEDDSLQASVEDVSESDESVYVWEKTEEGAHTASEGDKESVYAWDCKDDDDVSSVETEGDEVEGSLTEEQPEQKEEDMDPDWEKFAENVARVKDSFSWLVDDVVDDVKCVFRDIKRLVSDLVL
ncbi:hypothetical protein QR680_004455 [Steinernema hermaphroditum]|uniref:Uncharacterized protein n=1 Tax=Steinernema hermaphroditum TaxID=289476 RepID=A0AA39HQ60_9BILA|nr:hypothetical protein QR680_004455 [Steinernema hermaphroditum]